MKQSYLLITALAGCLATNAQLTQANHAPAVNDIYKLLSCDATSINPGASGAGATWNFSTITTLTSGARSYSAQAPSAANASIYPLANIAVTSAGNDFSYYNTSSTSLLYYGGNINLSTIGAVLIYTAPAVAASYPMALNTASASVTGGTLNATSPATASGVFTGSSTIVADGTGTLTLPGTVVLNNVTRVVTTQTIHFTAIVAGTVIQQTYEYFDPSVKGPLLSIRMATASTIISPPTSQVEVFRADLSFNALSDNNLDKAIALFPNPCTEFVMVNSVLSSRAQMLIFDATGKKVATFAIANGQNKIDVSGFNKGLYLYTIEGADGRKIKTGKITVAE